MNTGEAIWRAVFLLDYNTRLVVLATALLGVASGLVGTFLLLRKRSLMGDTLSHATLPGLSFAFICYVWFGGIGKSLPILLLGALCGGALGALSVLWIRQYTRLKDDAAMGIVLSVFFGAGVVLLTLIQKMPGASAAGLETFIYGNVASMVHTDLLVLTGAAIFATALSLLCFKEFRLLCFDEHYALAQGWPVRRLDITLLGLVTLITVAGLQAVGLILMIAFLIIPAAAARFWTDRLLPLLITSAVLGAASGWIGAGLSAVLPKAPAGAVIILSATGFFALSLIFGKRSGLLWRVVRQVRLRHKTTHQHLLRAIYELTEKNPEGPVAMAALSSKRSWSQRELRAGIRRARKSGFLESVAGAQVELTPLGHAEAVRLTRNHRLWEHYLLEYADVAPAHVDQHADAIEHVLEAGLVRRLEDRIGITYPKGEGSAPKLPPSPHALGRTEGGTAS